MYKIADNIMLYAQRAIFPSPLRFVSITYIHDYRSLPAVPHPRATWHQCADAGRGSANFNLCRLASTQSFFFLYYTSCPTNVFVSLCCALFFPFFFFCIFIMTFIILLVVFQRFTVRKCLTCFYFLVAKYTVFQNIQQVTN